MILVLLLALGFAAAGQTVSTADLFRDAARALQAGNLETAERGFRQVLQREPDNIGALGNLGVLYSRAGRPAQAVEVYLRALKLAPRQPGLLLNLSLAYLKLDNYPRAKDTAAELLAVQPSDQASEILAIARLQTGETAAAVAGLSRLAEAPRPSPAVLHFLALGYVKLGRRADAQPVIERLFELLPAARAHYLEGRIWYDAALFDQALASFSKATAADPQLAGLALELGKTHISLRNAPQARQALEQALAENPADLEAQYFLGALLVQDADPAAGLPLLERVLAARPDLWGTHYYLGKAKLALGRPADAIPHLETAVRLSPNEAPVHYQYARALQAAGRAADAKRAFARVASLRAAPEPLVMK